MKAVASRFSLASPFCGALYYAVGWENLMSKGLDYSYFSVGRFRFSITLRERARLPAYKGGTFRGAFGHVFKKIVCSARHRTCENCMLASTCPYAYIFDTPRPADAHIMRLYPQIPRPFVLEPPSTARREFQPGETLEFGLVLIGKALSHLPYFVFTFEQLGEAGIGVDRARFHLTSVTHCPPVGEKQTVYSPEERKINTPTPFTIDDLRKHQNGKSVTLNFQTPLRLQVQGSIARKVEFRPLISTLLRRLSAISYFHCGHELKLDFKRLVDAANQVEVENDQTRWYQWHRFSGRQKRRMNLGGLVGNITFSGELTKYWPLLNIAEIIHVGKATSFGLGKFEIANSASETVI